MSRIISVLFVLSSCASFTGVKETGGNQRYIYDSNIDYSSEELTRLSPGIVKTLVRDPQMGKLKKLFSREDADLKRIGVIIFESMIQPTLDGLAGNDKVYVSDQGKQLLTEKFLNIWNQSIPVLGADFNYVPIPVVKKSKKLHQYGLLVKDYIRSNRGSIAPDDIFYLPKGKATTSATVLNARNMQDLSFVLVPATDLMQGPKFSEHNKHFVNEVARELKLDAVMIVMSDISWTASRIDMRSGEIIPEEINLKIKSSTLIPMYQYHARLKNHGFSSMYPNTTLCYRAYEAQVSIPVLISVPAENENFSTIEKELLNPLMKGYKDVAQMTIIRMLDDMRLTH